MTIKTKHSEQHAGVGIYIQRGQVTIDGDVIIQPQTPEPAFTGIRVEAGNGHNKLTISETGSVSINSGVNGVQTSTGKTQQALDI